MTPQTKPPPARSRAKIWLFRLLAAVGVPALAVLGLEGGLRLAGFGHETGFLIPDGRPGWLRSNPDFTHLFLPGSFDLRPLDFRLPARKPAGTVRVVVLGESAAQGFPAPQFGFAPQLRAMLRARFPGRNVEVLDTGVVAINSHAVLRIAEDMARVSPDLFVVYLGNNEVVGPYGPGCAYLSAMPPRWIIRLSVRVRATRTGQLAAALLARLGGRGGRPAEWDGMAMFVDHAVRGDDPRLDAVHANFAANLRAIVATAADAGAKTLLCTVVANLKDCPPFLSLHRPDLAGAERAAWEKAFAQGRLAWSLGEAGAARTALEEARRLDPQFADTSFLLGSLALGRGETEAARRHFVEALRWDALRFRPDPRINEIVRQVASEDRAGVALADTALLLGADPASTAAPAGRELLFEHVHPDWEGNYRLAAAMAAGAEELLFGAGPGRPPWPDAAACAAVLAHTPHERLAVLLRIDALARRPPFTNQLTYAEDLAALAREIARAQADFGDAEKLAAAKEIVRAAVAADPENPALAAIERGIDIDRGDLEGALAAARRERELLPGDFAPLAEEASILARLGRAEEAEQLLRPADGLAGPVLAAPAWADFFTRTRRFEDGRRHFDAALARRPAEPKLRLFRGRLARAAGDTAAAEGDFRAALALAPAGEEALEALVSLLGDTGRRADADNATLAAAIHQPGNWNNNLRAAAIHEARGDEAEAVRFLLAAARSGPVNSAFAVRLAQKLYRLGRPDEALLHLAVARRLALHEGDPETTASIGGLIARLREETR